MSVPSGSKTRSSDAGIGTPEGFQSRNAILTDCRKSVCATVALSSLRPQWLAARVNNNRLFRMIRRARTKEITLSSRSGLQPCEQRVAQPHQTEAAKED